MRMTPSYAVQRLDLTAFRNYGTLRLRPTAAPVVLVGANGSGKTNILEAISLFAPGRGLRRAPLADLAQRHHASASTTPWAVVAEVVHAAGTTLLATGNDPDASGLPRRLARVDGKPVRSQTAFLDYINLSWITPELDRILAESQSVRRKFLDRLVFGFDPAHAARVTRYEEAMRERLRVLRDGPRDAVWLNALEDVMATTGTAIAAARRQMASQLNEQMQAITGAFPAAELRLSGAVETSLQHNPAAVAEEMVRAQLAGMRGADQQSGTTGIGPQRSDLQVIHRPHAMPSELCSTGEQKALLITVMLCHAQLLRQWRGAVPLLLLDDIAAHLDTVRREALYAWLLRLNGQFWLSGTEAALFKGLAEHAQFLHIQHGGIVAS
jgi:DNA replication and repair protein RecF